MLMFGGQVLSGGLEMHSSACYISSWWMLGVCWAAEQEAGAASPSTEEQALANALGVMWNQPSVPGNAIGHRAPHCLDVPTWVGIYTYVAV